jgi:hypothetical protein
MSRQGGDGSDVIVEIRGEKAALGDTETGPEVLTQFNQELSVDGKGVVSLLWPSEELAEMGGVVDGAPACKRTNVVDQQVMRDA